MPSQSVLWELFIVLEIEIISSDVTGDKNIVFGTEPFKYVRKSKLFGVIFLPSSLPMFEKYALNELAIS